MGVTTRKELITPKKAASFLESKASNRPLSERTARDYAAAMKAGEWKLNGESIKINDREEMEDGQHRCYGCILSDTPFESFVTRGLESNNGIFETIDRGKQRTIGHILARRGESNYCLLAGALTWLWRFRNGTIMTASKVSPRPPESTALLAENPEVRESCILGGRIRGLLSPSMAVCLHYLFSQKDAEEADSFFESLITGENLSASSGKTSGILLLRNRLLDDRASKAKLPQHFIFPLVVKAWNLFRSRKTAKTLRWRTEGNATEAFPEIQ